MQPDPRAQHVEQDVAKQQRSPSRFQGPAHLQYMSLAKQQERDRKNNVVLDEELDACRRDLYKQSRLEVSDLELQHLIVLPPAAGSTPSL